jgi:hypothetical protein
MKNLKAILISVIAIMFLSTNTYAGQWGVGVSGSIAAIGAEGTESETANTGTDNSVRSATASNNTAIGSVFAEYSADNGFTIGFDYIPGSADVSSKSIKRTDATADANETTQDDGDRTANAEIENHTTIYAEVPLHNGLFFKGGYVEMDVNTTESETVAGGSTYGTKTVDGLLYGLGYRNSFGTNGFYKVEGTHTAFDSISLASSSDHKISADLDVTQAKFSIGYNF